MRSAIDDVLRVGGKRPSPDLTGWPDLLAAAISQTTGSADAAPVWTLWAIA